MAVFIRHNKLSEAQYLFKQLRVDGAWPQAYALNALLNAYANNFRWVGALKRHGWAAGTRLRCCIAVLERS